MTLYAKSDFNSQLVNSTRERLVCAPVRRDNPLAKARGLSLRTSAQTMLYLSYTMISSVDLAHYGVSHAKD